MAKPKALDPLIAALIAKLPPEDQPFSEDEQVNWLKKMTMAMGLVYGGDAGARFVSAVSPAPNKPDVRRAEPAPPAKPKERVYAFIIDVDGVAKNGKTKKPIGPDEVTGGEIYDLRGIDGDVAAIVWANGQMGLTGYDGQILVG